MSDSPQKASPVLVRLIDDLRRRALLRVLAAYAVGAWALIEVVDTLGPDFNLPATATRLAVFAAVLAIPLVAALGWTYDLQPDAPAPRKRSRRLVILAASLPLGVGLLVGALRLLSAPSLDPDAARTLLAEARELVAAGRYAEAYPLVERAAAVLPEDSTAGALLAAVRVPVTILTEPEGAMIRALPATASDAVGAGSDTIGSWQYWGRSPVRNRLTPRFDHLVEVRADGHRPALRLVSPSFLFARGPTTDNPAPLEINIELIPATADVPEGMERVPAGEYVLASPDLGTDLTEILDEFFIDRYEVTNEKYERFVAGGGYENPVYWQVLPADMEPSDVPDRFTDRTGRPGPRDWRGQTYPEGTADHPVTGVNWYEATAYATSLGRSLPTFHQWEKTARNGLVTGRGYVLPWGVVRGGETGPARSRSQADGPGPVDEHPFGVSPFGAYAMAGNAKEWLANPFGAGRAVTGGSWQDPLYLFSEVGSVDPSTASRALGLRTVWLDPARRRLSRTQGLTALEAPPVPEYDPVDRRTFELLRRHYEYDPRPANAEVVSTVEAENWVQERVEFDGPEEQRVVAYLYLPNRALPPYQPIVYVPGNATFLGVTITDAAESVVGPLVAAGRAVFIVVMKGMADRPSPPGYVAPPTGSVAFRDRMVLHATELRLGLDYLDTRSDIDLSALAYAGQSWGAGSRLVFAGIDDRYRAVVFIGGGIDERVKPVLPEADNVNFAPYLDVPTLLVNGRQDEEHPWRTRGSALWELLSEPKRLVLLEGQGHLPQPDALVPTIREFLDEVIGPPELADQPG